MKKKIVSEDIEEEKKQRRSKVNEDKKTKQKSNAQKAIPFFRTLSNDLTGFR